MRKIKYILLAMAVIGFLMMISAVSTMDWYLCELKCDFPTYPYYMLGGGILMMIPALIYCIAKGE